MNQFAKISPTVTLLGEILKQDENGDFTIKSGIYLKRNECGICADDFSLICMWDNGRDLIPVKLIGGTFTDTDSLLDYIKSNIDKTRDGEIVAPKDNPTTLYVITGTELYDVTENNNKAVTIQFKNGTGYNNGIIINNSDIRTANDYVKGKYKVNDVTVNLGPSYLDSENKEINLGLLISDSHGNSETFALTDLNNISKYLIDKFFIGVLTVKLGKMIIVDNNYTFNILDNFSVGNPINITINYTPIS